jgi:F-type H+-transporting ATPase subunit delta
MANPAVAKEKKLALLDRLRGPLGLTAITRNFLAVLLENRRLDQLEAVLAAFDQEVYARLGIVPVEVTTAIALGAKQKQALEQRLAALTGTQVEMRFRENTEILAGGVARLGSTIYDGSLREQLRQLQRQLTSESGR